MSHYNQQYGDIGSLINQWLSQYSDPTSSQSYQFLNGLAQRGGGAAGALRSGAGGAPDFYTRNMNAQDPLGTIANTKGFAKKTYGPASTGINSAYNDALRMWNESTGGMQSGGVNPRAGGYMKGFMGAQKAGDLGTLWGQLQGTETQMMNQALESTGSYRKAQADALREYGTALSGATSADQSYQGDLAKTMLGATTGDNAQVLQFLAAIMGPLLQRGSFRQGGLGSDQSTQFLLNLLGM